MLVVTKALHWYWCVLSKFKNIKICGSIFLSLRIFFCSSFSLLFASSALDCILDIWPACCLTAKHIPTHRHSVAPIHLQIILKPTQMHRCLRLWSCACLFGFETGITVTKCSSKSGRNSIPYSFYCWCCCYGCYSFFFRGDSKFLSWFFYSFVVVAFDCCMRCALPTTLQPIEPDSLNFMQVMMMHL